MEGPKLNQGAIIELKKINLFSPYKAQNKSTSTTKKLKKIKSSNHFILKALNRPQKNSKNIKLGTNKFKKNQILHKQAQKISIQS